MTLTQPRDMPEHAPQASESRATWAFVAFLAIAGFFLTEHRAHLWGVLPFLLLLACPLLHFFHHRDAHSHDSTARANEIPQRRKNRETIAGLRQESMPLTTHLDIVSAEALIFSGPVTKVAIPAEAGEICALARHTPLVTRLRPGLVRFANEFEIEQSFFVSSGFVEIQPSIITILADTVLRTKDLDKAAAQAALERAREAMAKGPPTEDYDKLLVELKMEMALLRAIDEIRRK